MSKPKIKAKEKNGVVKVKAMFTSLMADKEEATKKGIDVSYIRQITASINGVMVYDLSLSGFMSENPLLKFKTKGGKKGDKIEFVAIDNNNKKITAKKKIK